MKEGDPLGLLLLIIVCGSRDDLTKWFRQIPVCSDDMHKQVYNWAAQYLTDGHVQMGRVSSADGAQRVPLLARRRLWGAVEEELRRRLRDDRSALWDVLRRAAAQRSSAAGARHTGLWALGLMQDDLAWVALTRGRRRRNSRDEGYCDGAVRRRDLSLRNGSRTKRL